MIKDLNPINTPNSALTDCLNGTIITYNGNEHSLQNDKGNYALRNCKLPKNYLPVGLKEYGDILYIVSYNPITKKTQIGSYPSPEIKSDELRHDDLLQLVITIKDQIKADFDSNPEKNELVYNYTDIIKDYQKKILFYGADQEYDKIYPGDEIQIVTPA